MSDVADLTSSMIIRPGLKPVWYFIGGGYSNRVEPQDEVAKRRAKSKHTFGEIELFERCRPNECCGVIFVARPNGSITRPDFWRMQWFFHRDGAEALVFEFDCWQERFFARSELSLWNRCQARQ